MLPRSKITYYYLLSVEPTASVQEIKSAYHQLAKIWHPDKGEWFANLSDEKKQYAQEVFARISTAYSILSNPVKRRDYDNTLLTQTEEHPLDKIREDEFWRQWKLLERTYLIYRLKSKIAECPEYLDEYLSNSLADRWELQDLRIQSEAQLVRIVELEEQNKDLQRKLKSTQQTLKHSQKFFSNPSTSQASSGIKEIILHGDKCSGEWKNFVALWLRFDNKDSYNRLKDEFKLDYLDVVDYGTRGYYIALNAIADYRITGNDYLGLLNKLKEVIDLSATPIYGCHSRKEVFSSSEKERVYFEVTSVYRYNSMNPVYPYK